MEVHIELVHDIEWYVHRLLRNKSTPNHRRKRGGGDCMGCKRSLAAVSVERASQGSMCQIVSLDFLS